MFSQRAERARRAREATEAAASPRNIPEGAEGEPEAKTRPLSPPNLDHLSDSEPEHPPKKTKRSTREVDSELELDGDAVQEESSVAKVPKMKKSSTRPTRPKGKGRK